MQNATLKKEYTLGKITYFMYRARAIVSKRAKIGLLGFKRSRFFMKRIIRDSLIFCLLPTILVIFEVSTYCGLLISTLMSNSSHIRRVSNLKIVVELC